MNKFILPGSKPVLELLAKSPEKIKKIKFRPELPPRLKERLEFLCNEAGIPLEAASARELDAECGKNGHTAHQGILAILHSAKALALSEFLQQAKNAPLPVVVALDQVQDPGNLGTLARSAYALGAGGILTPTHNAAGLSPAALKSSAGALLQLPLCPVPNLARALDSCEEAGYHIYGAAMAAANSENAFTMRWSLPAIIVLGSEETGIRPGVIKRCGVIITIPFKRPFDSLNVAQTGGMLLALCAASKYN